MEGQSDAGSKSSEYSLKEIKEKKEKDGILERLKLAFNGIPVNAVAEELIDYYLKDEARAVQDLYDEIAGKADIIKFLSEEIRKRNGLGDKNAIPFKRDSIKIPDNITFFEKAFPRYLLFQTGKDTISTRYYVLDKFYYQPDFEKVAAGELEAGKVSWEAARVMDGYALHLFKIHSPPPLTTRFAVDGKATVEGIKIFQKEYMEDPAREAGLYKELGVACKNTLLAMNEALREGWHRKLYFYYQSNPQDAKYESYVNDADINNALENDIFKYEIWAYNEKDGTRMPLGKKVRYQKTKYYGLQRYARSPLCPFIPDSTAGNYRAQLVIAGTVSNEGAGSSGQKGGYDTVNEYDKVGLSIGLFHFSQTDLYNLLYGFRSNPNFNTLFSPLNISFHPKGVMEIDGERCGFQRESSESVKGKYDVLRKLKLVYYFLKAADNQAFRDCQLQYALNWLDDIRNRIVRGGPVRDYISSEYGTALLLDLTVRCGRGDTGRYADEAIGIVAARLGDDPAKWGDNSKEDPMIPAIREIREHNMNSKSNQDEAQRREGRIAAIEPKLSRNRGSFIV